MSLLIELLVIAAFLIVGLIGGTHLARRIRRDDSEEKRRAEEVQALSDRLKQSVKKDRQREWIESWEKERR
jgi:sensor domain CHASE-containing protein